MASMLTNMLCVFNPLPNILQLQLPVSSPIGFGTLKLDKKFPPHAEIKLFGQKANTGHFL
jgi:hypothetical protein